MDDDRVYPFTGVVQTNRIAMRKIDQYNLVTKIALHLQQTMTTSEINVFLGGFDIEHDCVSIVDSKRTYVMKLLADVEPRTIVKVATELGIEFPNRASQSAHELVNYLSSGGLEAAHEDFERAMASIESDPALAIASSCSTLESICKAILDACGEDYPSDESLQPLVKTVNRVLDLSPDGQADPEIKRILGGLENASFGIAVLRTKFSSAHGRGKSQFKSRLNARHARLTVNVASTVGYFLIETYHERARSSAHS